MLAVSLAEGILVFTYHRQAKKIYEVYDKLLFAGTGQQSDVEAMRVAAVDFAHQEGYNRSEQDVTIQRVATALSGPLKKAFSDFSASPLIARTLFAEVNETPDEDIYYLIDYDGDYQIHRHWAVLTGSEALDAVFKDQLVPVQSMAVPEALEAMKEVWRKGMEREETPADENVQRMKPEAVLFERASIHENRFRRILDSE